jgi:hypothetical protein
MTTYRIEIEPAFVEDGDGAPLPGHYEAEFTTERGERVRRFLTDKGRAEVLRAMELGPASLSADELDEHTVEPDLDALVRRMSIEGGVGA